MTEDILLGAVKALAYVGLGGAILIFGYFVHDILTPGRLGTKSRLLYKEGNVNVAVVSGSHLLASGIVIATAIWTTQADFTDGIITTAVFGLVGVLILTITELLVDAFTPGKLTDFMIAPKFQPVSAFMATINVVVGIIVAVSIA